VRDRSWPMASLDYRTVGVLGSSDRSASRSESERRSTCAGDGAFVDNDAVGDRASVCAGGALCETG
jgi:hypothetical protein